MKVYTTAYRPFLSEVVVVALVTLIATLIVLFNLRELLLLHGSSWTNSVGHRWITMLLLLTKESKWVMHAARLIVISGLQGYVVFWHLLIVFGTIGKGLGMCVELLQFG